MTENVPDTLLLNDSGPDSPLYAILLAERETPLPEPEQAVEFESWVDIDHAMASLSEDANHELDQGYRELRDAVDIALSEVAGMHLGFADELGLPLPDQPSEESALDQIQQAVGDDFVVSRGADSNTVLIAPQGLPAQITEGPTETTVYFTAEDLREALRGVENGDITITHHSTVPTGQEILGMPVAIDPGLPMRDAHLRDSEGNVIATFQLPVMPTSQAAEPTMELPVLPAGVVDEPKDTSPVDTMRDLLPPMLALETPHFQGALPDPQRFLPALAGRRKATTAIANQPVVLAKRPNAWRTLIEQRVIEPVRTEDGEIDHSVPPSCAKCGKGAASVRLAHDAPLTLEHLDGTTCMVDRLINLTITHQPDPAETLFCTGLVTCTAETHRDDCFGPLGKVKVQFWACPVHDKGTVEWTEVDGRDVAFCMETGCTHTSADPQEKASEAPAAE